MKHLLLSLTSMFFLCTPLMHAEEDEPLFIPMNQTPKTGKRMPPRYMSYLTYYDGEACFLNKIFLCDKLNIINTWRNNI